MSESSSWGSVIVKVSKLVVVDMEVVKSIFADDELVVVVVVVVFLAVVIVVVVVVVVFWEDVEKAEVEVGKIFSIIQLHPEKILNVPR